MESMDPKPALLKVTPSLGLLVYRCLLLLLLTGILMVQLQTMRASGRLITVGELRQIGELVRDKKVSKEVYQEAALRALAVDVQGTVDVAGTVSVDDPIAVTIDDTVTIDGDVNCN